MAVLKIDLRDDVLSKTNSRLCHCNFSPSSNLKTTERCAGPRGAQQKQCARRANFNPRWPAHDKWPASLIFLGEGGHFFFFFYERERPPPQVAEDWKECEEEDEEEETSHLLQHVTVLYSSLRSLVCGRQAGQPEERIWSVCLWMVVCMLSFLSTMSVNSVSPCVCVCLFACMCLQSVDLCFYIEALWFLIYNIYDIIFSNAFLT